MRGRPRSAARKAAEAIDAALDGLREGELVQCLDRVKRTVRQRLMRLYRASILDMWAERPRRKEQ